MNGARMRAAVLGWKLSWTGVWVEHGISNL